MTELLLAFLAGLAGSVHCLGMCGGIVAAVSMAGSADSMRVRALSYHCGRIVTYGVLGFGAGLLGPSLDLLRLKEFSFFVMAAAQLFVILVGAATLSGGAGVFALDGSGGGRFAGLLRSAAERPSAARFFLLGMALGLLPCGLVYAPLASAAGSGGAVRGALTMVSLGAGTIPLLFVGASSLQLLPLSRKRVILRASGFFILLLGLWQLRHVISVAGWLQ